MVKQALRAARLYARLFRGPVDVWRYGRLRVQHRLRRDREIVRNVRIRELGGVPLACRSGQDVWTLRSTFLKRFHLPPVPLPKSARVVDLGANVGYTLAHLAHLHPTARIVGVELDGENLALARSNTAHYGDRVQLVEAAVWRHDGEVAYGGVEVDSFHVIGAPGTAERRVRAVSMPTLMAECGLDTIDYLKVDIEGAEAEILTPSATWLGRVRALNVEIHPPASYHRLAEVLAGHGFEVAPHDDHSACLVAVRNEARP